LWESQLLAALSKQISTLEQAGYVTVNKTGAGRRSRTYVRLSARGREAFNGHVAALQKLVNLSVPDEEPAS
jgi:DNA-binding MarR family transcriptional regulator